MATGDTKLTICNDALIMLGANTITSFSDGSDAAKITDRLYDDIKALVMTMYPWSFATKKVQIARTTNTPVTEWNYEYQLPGDLLAGPIAVFNTSASGARPVREWERYEDKVLTNYESVYIDYWFPVVESKMPQYFVQLLKYFLAWHFAEPVTDQFTKGQYWQGTAVGTPQENGRGGYFRQAMNIDGGSQPNQAIEDFALVDVRY